MPNSRRNILISLAAIALMAASFMGFGGNEEELQAANPTFWLSTLATDSNDFPTSLGVEFDPTAEGTGSLGAETHITYNASDVSVSSVSFGTCIFDSCIDLSEEGVIKLLGASGKPENGGTLVTTQSRMATVGLSFTASSTLTFTKCQVINQNEELKTCSSTNLVVNPGAVCGNSVIETGETCDDGNTDNGDGCSDSCQIEAVCGNSTTEAGEECDDGNVANGDGCSDICELESTCGDGVIEGVEECDDGNATSQDGCSAICMNEVCGDGVLQLGLGEQCDDGNLVDGDDCSATCQDETLSVCGNGIIENGEACDDGNASNLDACTDTCAVAVCGDTFVQTGVEQCDDGNAASGDGCSDTCALETVCGDGNQEGIEQCDDGNAVNTDGCTNICMNAACGDGFVQSGVEQCDDGNLSNNDGCSDICELEPIENPVCGNNIVEGAETCDDGNTDAGDGCSAQCLLEAAQLESIDVYIGTGFSSTVSLGNYIQLDTFAFFDDGSSLNITTPDENNPIQYSSSSSFTASVIGDRVIPVNPGNATITASYTANGITKTDSVDVTVASGPICGNNTVEDGEQCDDGNTTTEACAYGQQSCTVCNATCNEEAGAATFCGDGALQDAEGEVCDDGNTVTEACAYGLESCTVCTATCTEEAGSTSACGDGAVQGADGETCDDGNTADGDGCSATCTLEVVPEPEEPAEPAPAEDEPAEAEAPADEPAPAEDAPAEPVDDGTDEIILLQEELKPAAIENQEEIEAEAALEAEEIVETEVVEEESAAEVDTPDTQEEVVTRIDVCKQNFPTLDFENRTLDADGDGLSNRVECYAGTDPLVPDTDNDACADGDEINQLNSNPNDASDCIFTPQVVTRVTDTGETVEEVVLPKVVLVSDPQPGWILPNTVPRVSGVVPVGTSRVTLTAVHADQKVLKQLIAAVEALMADTSLEGVQRGVAQLSEPTSLAEGFLQENKDFFDYAALESGVQMVNSALVDLTTEISEFQSLEVAEGEEKPVFSLQADLEAVLASLETARQAPISLGSSLTFSETFIGEGEARRFEFISQNNVIDGKLYDVIAEAELEDGETIRSAPIRFGVNSGVSVRQPVPRTLGNVPLGGGTFGSLMIDNVFAQGGEVEIEQDRPTVSGDTDFGSHVFAIWNSVVLASSTISDSEQGSFEIQAPRSLDPSVSHRLTLYAVKEDAGNKLRSDSVDVFFRIKPAVAANRLPLSIGIGVGILVLLLVLILVGHMVRKRKKPVEGLIAPDLQPMHPSAPESTEGEAVETPAEAPSHTQAPAPAPAPEQPETPTVTPEQPAAESPAPEATQEQPAIRPLPDSSAPALPEEFDKDEKTSEVQPLAPDAVTEPEQDSVVEESVPAEAPEAEQPEAPAAEETTTEEPTSSDDEGMTDDEKRMLGQS